MNPDTPDIPPSPIKEASAAAVGGVAPVVAPPVVHARHPVSWMSVLALVVAALSLVLAGLIWQKLGFTQQELARRSQDSTEQAVEVRTVAKQAEALTQELQARLAVAEIKLSEVTLQRSQLEELMLALSRSRDDNLVQDIESALRLGFQQTQLTGSVQPLVSALLAADQRIARAAQPRLNPVQRAIQRDIDAKDQQSGGDESSGALEIFGNFFRVKSHGRVKISENHHQKEIKRAVKIRIILGIK